MRVFKRFSKLPKKWSKNSSIMYKEPSIKDIPHSRYSVGLQNLDVKRYTAKDKTL